MERKGLRKKDILRMDGLLPPTRRLPVCDAVSGTPDKKKDKKWSLGGILRRISSIKDYDSSSNDEEIVYCKRTPKKPTKLNRQPDGVVLHSIENNSEYDKRMRIESNIRQLTDSPSHSRRDSLHSRSSDGSLDGLGKKIRKNQLKARAEAKRDHLCVDSSSDDDCRRSNSSLNRFHGAADGAYNGQRGNVCSRKTRAARTERYIKRLSRDDGNGSGDTLNEPHHHKRYSAEYTAEDEQHRAVVYADANGSCRPPIHPRRTVGASATQKSTNSRTFPIHRSSAENLRHADCYVGLPEPEIGLSSDVRRYSVGHYVTDMNQNNTYGKMSRNADVDARQPGNFFTYPAKNIYYSEPFDQVIDRGWINSDSRPPEPPPRDPRYRVLGYGYISHPTSSKQNTRNSYGREENETSGLSRPDWRNFRSYGSNSEIARCDAATDERGTGNPTESNPRADLRNSLEYINNKYNSSRHCASESAYKETETMRCRRRNTRNDQLNCNDANYSVRKAKNKSTNICESSKRETTPSYMSVASSDWLSRKPSRERIISRSITPSRDVDKRVERSRKEEDGGVTPAEEEAAERERRRSSKNLEEALTELEAIYNSLRLGDEELLDRAERRSMEEFSLKQKGKSELDAAVTAVPSPDSPDRTKDDMAYRRMHPKERPASLSDPAGQSSLFNISYLIASPVLSRKDSADDFARVSSTGGCSFRRDEPDVTLDDVVYRSINHANNTLKVIEPQPPFGIPLGPVTAATESDYLHTTPTKPEQPRSPYIPQCEPDVVTDDLAYRALRKDACVSRNTAESKCDASPRDPTAAVNGVRKKKRAVRSMSASLYGLINHDRIHLRREPRCLDAIKDEIQEAARNFNATPERPGYLRRVVSDGELSDNDARKRKEPVREGGIDINGNHPTVVACEMKLSDTYVPPGSAPTRQSPKKEESSIAELSNVMLSSEAVLENEFWHEYLRSDSNASNANSHSTEADFTAYSRLCQDLVNMIRSGDESPNTSADAGVIVDKSNDIDAKSEADEPPTTSGQAVRSLESHHHSGLQRTVRASEKRENEAAAFPANSAEPESESTPSKNLDFYLRVADENVKLIAAAFGSVADHLRDSRLTARKSSSTSHDVSEMENQSCGSTRSSTLYSQDDTNDDQSLATPVVTISRLEEVISKRDSATSNEGDRSSSSPNYIREDTLTADVELDLSRAVRDLQLAAASLCEHGPEIEELTVGRRRRVDARVHNVTPVTVTSTDENEDSPMRKINLIAEALRQEPKEELEEGVQEAAITAISGDGNADNGLISKTSHIASVLTQERERDQEEVTVLPIGIAKTRRDSREENCEGERTVCELDRKSSCYTEDVWSCVTNLVTRVTVTTYSMLLLACLLALLLATLAAS